MRIHEHVARYGVDTVHLVGGTLPSLEVRHLRPIHTQFCHCFLPVVSLLVERYAHYLEALGGVIAVVGSHYVGHLATAGTTPGSPEVYEHILAFAYPLAELDGLAVHILHGELMERLARLALALGLEHADNALHRGMRVIGGRSVANLLQLLVAESIDIVHQRNDGQHGGTVFFDESHHLVHLCLAGSLQFLHQRFLGSLIDVGLLHLSINLVLLQLYLIQSAIEVVQLLILLRSLQLTCLEVDMHGGAVIEHLCLPQLFLGAVVHNKSRIGRFATGKLKGSVCIHVLAHGIARITITYEEHLFNTVGHQARDFVFHILCEYRCL